MNAGVPTRLVVSSAAGEDAGVGYGPESGRTTIISDIIESSLLGFSRGESTNGTGTEMIVDPSDARFPESSGRAEGSTIGVGTKGGLWSTVGLEPV